MTHQDGCHCGGRFKPADHGLVPLLTCEDCGREVQVTAMTTVSSVSRSAQKEGTR